MFISGAQIMADGLRRKILKVLNGFSPRRKELTVLIILQGKRKNHRKVGEGMTTCDYCGKTVESEQAAITGIGWVVCPTCAKVYGKLDGIVTKAEKPQATTQG